MTNPRFLILAPYFFPYQNPRARRIMRIIEHLDKVSSNIDVICSSRSEKPKLFSKKVQIHPCGFNSLKERFSSLSGIPQSSTSKKDQSLFLKDTAKKINTLLLKSFYWPDDSFLWIKPALKKANKLIKEHSYDAIISFSLPYAGALVAEQLKLGHPNVKWINDIGDPLAFQTKNQVNNIFLYESKNRKTEARLLNTADLSIVTNSGLKKIYQQELNITSNKIEIVGPFNQIGKPITQKPNNQTLRFLYLGSFYKSLRSPKRLIKFFSEVKQQVPNLNPELHIAGNLSSYDLKILEANDKIKSMLVIHPFLSKEKTQELIAQSHFLINLSNNSVHQLPSKCADYVASCLPIINIFEEADDVSKSYLKSHPLHYNYNSRYKSENQSESLKNFIQNGKDKTIKEEKSLNLLKKSNPSYMVFLIQDLLKQ
jgi:hypothetical protein